MTRAKAKPSSSPQEIRVAPLAGALGAEVFGPQLASLKDEGAWQSLQRAFLDYSVLVIRDQAIEPADLMRIGARFGPPCHYPFVIGMDAFPYIFEVVKEPAERKNFGGAWHSDTAYLKQPPLATLLHACSPIPPPPTRRSRKACARRCTGSSA